MAIIAILAAIATPLALQQRHKSTDAAMKADILKVQIGVSQAISGWRTSPPGNVPFTFASPTWSIVYASVTIASGIAATGDTISGQIWSDASYCIQVANPNGSNNWILRSDTGQVTSGSCPATALGGLGSLPTSTAASFPGAVSGFTAVNTTGVSNSADLSWASVAGATSYAISTTGASTVSTTVASPSVSTTIPNLNGGSTTFSIRAVNASGSGLATTAVLTVSGGVVSSSGLTTLFSTASGSATLERVQIGTPGLGLGGSTLTADSSTIQFGTNAALATASWIAGRADGGLNFYTQSAGGSIVNNLSMTTTGNVFNNSVQAASGTASTNSTTGALVVTGGEGVSGSLYIGGNLNVTGTCTGCGVAAAISDDNSTNATYYLALATVTSGTLSAVKTSSTKLTFNPSTGLLTATSFGSTTPSTATLNTNGDTGGLVIATGADANKGLVLKGNSATQSAALLEIQSSYGNLLGSVDPNGNFFAQGLEVKSRVKAATIGSNLTATYSNGSTTSSIICPPGYIYTSGNYGTGQPSSACVSTVPGVGVGITIGVRDFMPDNVTPMSLGNCINSTYSSSGTLFVTLNHMCWYWSGPSVVQAVATYSAGSGVGATLTNAGAQVAFALDGYTSGVGDRILIKDQTAAAQNGIYTVTTLGSGATNWVLTRASDADIAMRQAAEVVAVDQGTINAGTFWKSSLKTTDVVGTTSNLFSSFTGSGTAPTISDDTATNATYYLALATTTSGNLTAVKTSSSKLNFNPSTGVLTATGDAIIHGLTVGTGPGVGAGNLALGTSANAGNTGTYNTAVGYLALSGGDSGLANTAVGSQALQNNTSANANAALGYQALTADTTGGGNSGIGYQALTANQAGTLNTAAGYQALSTLNGGSYNTAFGYLAGSLVNTTSGNNIFLGSNSGPASSSTISNQLFIGNIGTPGTTSGTPLIWGYQNTTIAGSWVTINALLAATAGITISTGSNLQSAVATYTVTATDYSIILTGIGATTVTLPTCDTSSLNNGRILFFRSNGAGGTTISSAVSNVILLGSSTSGATIVSNTAGKYAQLQCQGSSGNWYELEGN